MMILSAPLKKMRCTQPFGVNWVEPGFYKSVGIPSDKHNGWDLKAIEQPIYAPCDGSINSYWSETGGSMMFLRTPMTSDGVELEQFFCHCKETAPPGIKVKRGEQIGVTGNSGTGSKGPHLHYGLRILRNGLVENYSNGYHGFLDPTQMYPSTIFNLPVDDCYGNKPSTPGVMDEWTFYKAAAYFWKTVGRLPSVQERNAIRYGFWDLRAVLDPAMVELWREMSKPEAIKRGLI